MQRPPRKKVRLGNSGRGPPLPPLPPNLEVVNGLPVSTLPPRGDKMLREYKVWEKDIKANFEDAPWPIDFKLTEEMQAFAQEQEANLHQFEVDRGLCWRQMYPPTLEASNIGPEFLKSSNLEWSPIQKAQFIELVGRRGKTNLLEISKIVGKPLLQCQIYLQMLEEASKSYGLQIDYAEIPASLEVTEPYIEPSYPYTAQDSYDLRRIYQGQLSRSKKLKEGWATNWSIIDPIAVNKISDTPLDVGGLLALQTSLHDLLKSWFTVLFRMLPHSKRVTINGRILRYLMVHNAHQFRCFNPSCFDGLEQSKFDPKFDEISPTIDFSDSDSDVSINSDSTVESYFDSSSDLEIDECEFLESVDQFNSRADLVFRGCRQFVDVPPPAERSDELVKYMRTSDKT